MTVRVLGPADVPALQAFLLAHADSSLFLRSNLHAGGVVDRGEPYQATYVAAFDGGRIVAVAAHSWVGFLTLQAPVRTGEVVRAALDASGRPLRGFSGPWAQVVAARAALGVTDAQATFASQDDLFALDLEGLVVPPALAAGRVACRPARDDELDLVVGWHVAYSIELFHEPDGPAVRADARRFMELHHRAGSRWLLEEDGRPVASTGFNARLPDVVQIGGVYTPPALRGRGYARAAVAGSLLAVKATGVRRAVLFTGRENEPARRTYLALGFRSVGDFGFVHVAAA
jgi:RimJ/RimL family protein N-acetyltransferase